jgi:hypothetical protein
LTPRFAFAFEKFFTLLFRLSALVDVLRDADQTPLAREILNQNALRAQPDEFRRSPDYHPKFRFIRLFIIDRRENFSVSISRSS